MNGIHAMTCTAIAALTVLITSPAQAEMLTLPAFWYVRTTLLSDEFGSQLIGPNRYRHLNTSTMLPGGLLRR